MLFAQRSQWCCLYWGRSCSWWRRIRLSPALYLHTYVSRPYRHIVLYPSLSVASLSRLCGCIPNFFKFTFSRSLNRFFCLPTDLLPSSSSQKSVWISSPFAGLRRVYSYQRNCRPINIVSTGLIPALLLTSTWVTLCHHLTPKKAEGTGCESVPGSLKGSDTKSTPPMHIKEPTGKLLDILLPLFAFADLYCRTLSLLTFQKQPKQDRFFSGRRQLCCLMY